MKPKFSHRLSERFEKSHVVTDSSHPGLHTHYSYYRDYHHPSQSTQRYQFSKEGSSWFRNFI